MPILMLKYWKQLLLVVVSGVIIFQAVHEFNTYVEQRVLKEYDAKVSDYRKQVLESIKAIEATSTKLVEAREHDQLVTSARLDEILFAAQRKGFVTITKEGKCNPSKEFSDTYNDLISEGNRK